MRKPDIDFEHTIEPKTLLHGLVVGLAVIPATLLFVFCIGLICVTISSDLGVEFSFLAALILCVFGYVGLILLLLNKKSKKREIVNPILLVMGVVGVELILYNLRYGTYNWTWFLEVDDLMGWYIMVYPNLVAIFFIIFKSATLIIGFFRKTNVEPSHQS